MVNVLLKFVLLFGLSLSVASVSAENINPFPYPVIDCKGCTLDEMEAAVSQQAVLDQVVKVAVVNAFEGKAYTYDVEKVLEVIDENESKITTILTPVPVDEELVEGAAQLREMLVEMWNLNSEERKEWLRAEAKKPLKPNQERIFVLEEN